MLSICLDALVSLAVLAGMLGQAPQPGAAEDGAPPESGDTMRLPDWRPEGYVEPDPESAVRTIDPAIQRVLAETRTAMGEEGAAGPDGRYQTAPPPPSPGRLNGGLRAAAALAAVLALIYLLVFVSKRMGKNTPLFGGASLARVLGKVYLAPKACLHFVETGGKVLVVGVVPNAISVVAEFDADSFEYEDEGRGRPGKENGEEDGAFISHLRSRVRGPDDDLAGIRGDIQRLQGYIEEHASEPGDD